VLAKNPISILVVNKFGRDNVVNGFLAVISEFRQNGLKGQRKFVGCLIEFFTPVSAQSEVIAKQYPEKKGDYSDSRMREYIDKQIVQSFVTFIFLVIGYLAIGCIIVLLIQKIHYIAPLS
jgi:hypothetical protein